MAKTPGGTFWKAGGDCTGKLAQTKTGQMRAMLHLAACGIIIPQGCDVMPFGYVLWDLDDDPEGNVQHCAEHGVTKEEVEEALNNANDTDFSRSSGRPMVFGDTTAGRHLVVVYEEIDSETIYPITAYEVPRRQST